jgi:hypothetical protein
MQTPLQLLIDYLTKYDGMPTVRVIRKCHDLLAVERECILKAHEAGSYTSNNTIPEAKENACKYFERAYGTTAPAETP